MMLFSLCYTQFVSGGEWILDSRIWTGQKPGYISNQQYDFSQSVSPYTNADTSVITVTSLPKSIQYRGMCRFSSIDIGEDTILSNALFVLDIQIQIPASCTKIEISFANSVSGVFTNISITGSIKLTNVLPTQVIKLSKFAGKIFNSSFLTTQYFSNLSYSINGVEVTANSTNVNLYETNFDGKTTTATKLTSIDTAVVNTTFTSCSGSHSVVVTHAASQQPGLIQEWYEQRLDLLEWKISRDDYYFIDFTSAGLPTVNKLLSTQRVYYGNDQIPIIVYFNNGSVRECSVGQFFNPTTQTCNASCPAKQFNMFCLASCSDLNLYDSNNDNKCYSKCPAALGYVLVTTTCTLCTTPNLLAYSNGGCTASCPAGFVQSGSGCFFEAQTSLSFSYPTCSTVCDPGMLMDDGTCLSSCSDGKISQDELRVCVACASEYNGGKYWNRTTQLCSFSCDYYNGTFCEVLGSSYCEYYFVDKVSGFKICVHSCPNEFPLLQPSENKCQETCPIIYMTDYVNKTCVDSCASGYYSFSFPMRICLTTCGSTNFTAKEADKHASNLRCESACSIFDSKPYHKDRTCTHNCYDEFHMFINYDNFTCVSSCPFYNRTTTGYLFCQADCDSKFNGLDLTYDDTFLRCESACNLFSSRKFTKDNLCQDQCDGLKPYYVAGDLCVENCFSHSDQLFIDETNKFCTPTCINSNYYRDNSTQFLYCNPTACGSSNYTLIQQYHLTYQRCEKSCTIMDTYKYSLPVQTFPTLIRHCFEKCDSQYKYFDADLICNDKCPDTIPYAEKSNLCNARCDSGNYSARADIQKFVCSGPCDTFYTINETNGNSKQCVDSCLALTERKYLLNTEECVSICPSGNYSFDKLTKMRMCTDCVNMYYGTDSNFTTPMTRCETSCSLFSSLKYTKNYQCLDQCDSEKPVYTTGNICQFNCYSQPTEKFLNSGSNKCVSSCAHSSYYRNADGTLFCTSDVCGPANFTGVESYHASYQRCESSCALFASLSFTDGSSCLEKCPDDRKYFIAAKNCSATCPEAIPFAEASNLCVSKCGSGNYAATANAQKFECRAACDTYFVTNETNDNSHECVAECLSQPSKKFLDTDSKECLASCPQPFYNVVAATGFQVCLPNCDAGFRGKDATFDVSMERCEAACDLFSTTKFTKDQLCQDACDGLKPVYVTGNLCVENCFSQASEVFLNEGSNQCRETCAHPSYYRNADGTLFCTSDVCGPANFTGVESYHASYQRCESSCALFASLSFTDGSSCLEKCPDDRKYFIAAKNCSATCPTDVPYAEASNLCVCKCGSGNYAATANAQKFECRAACDTYFVTNETNDNSHECVAECLSQPSKKFLDTDSKECLASCPQPFYNVVAATGFQVCLPNCDAGFRGKDATFDVSMERCEAACNLFSTTKFTKDQLCQDACDGLKPVYVTGNLCVENCFSQASEIFLNEGSNQCRETCAHPSYYRNADGTLFCTSDVCGPANFTGVESYHASYQRCESSCALFASLSFTDGSSCLEKCPDDRKYFIAAKNCSATCPTDVPYAEASNLCVCKCGSGNYAATANAQKFECRAACDTYFVTNETNDNSHECVAECLSQPSKKFLDTDSKECLASCPQPFYNIVAATGFQVCLPNCDAGFHGKDATFHVSMERCEAACNLFSTTKFTKDQLCQDACDGLKPVYVTGNLCVENCFSQASEVFLNEGSNQCRDTCAHSSYYRNSDGKLFCTSDVCGSSNFTGVESYHASYQRCESSCALFASLSFIDGSSCLGSCPAERKYFDSNKNCSAVCPEAIPFAEASNLCVSKCGSGNYAATANAQKFECRAACDTYFVTNETNDNSHECVAECHSQPSKKFLDTDSKECLASCPQPFYNVVAATGFQVCLPNCDAGFHGKDATFDVSMERCEAACNLFSTTKFTKDQLCQDACDGLKPVYVTGNLCVENCFSQASEIFLNEGSNQCRETCAHPSYYRNSDGKLFCTSDVCGSSNFTGVESYHASYQRCESSCALFTSLSFTDGSSCLGSCPAERKYFDSNKNCSAVCPEAIPFAEASNLCVSKCGSGNYAATANAQKFECRAACDTYFVTNETNDNSHECVAECHSQPSKKFLDTDSKECLASCPQPFYNVVAATGFQVCLPNCDAGFRGKDATFDVSMERCEAACDLFSTTKFTKDQLCQDACDGLKPVYVTGNLCVENCFSQASEVFLNEGSNQCRETCAHSSYYRNADGSLFCTSDVCGSSNFTGVESYHATYQRCESTCTLFANLTHTLANACVKSCPDTDKYFDSKLICYSVCPSLYSFAESTNQCVQKCNSGKYIKVTNQSQTLLCTPECTQYFLTNESNQDSQLCVDSCESQAVKNILNVSNNECVSQCKNSYLSEDRTKCYISCALDNNNVLSIQKTHCVSNCFTSERSALAFTGGYCVSDCKSDNPNTDFNAEKTKCIVTCNNGIIKRVNIKNKNV
ncbi:Conserved_hypothetical protein [Hexamita inflata]|uniref:Uncharacterized protein n=1 Tax=Hexamita inflata TaxID=28002 RepID=A0AA86UUT7_9EUKA|nr:Conserved hypothetical protein [Hexamita inflata]